MRQPNATKPTIPLKAHPYRHTSRAHAPTGHATNPTTSFLTATTLIYAIGAGITAGAGTRLVLQLFLVKGFKLYSFQLQVPCRDLYCYLLSLPPRIAIG